LKKEKFWNRCFSVQLGQGCSPGKRRNKPSMIFLWPIDQPCPRFINPAIDLAFLSLEPLKAFYPVLQL
jgi:hypothetical protein